jgi:hypothetical protein
MAGTVSKGYCRWLIPLNNRRIVRKFALRLVAGGHAKADLIPIFKDALQLFAKFSNKPIVAKDTLFCHAEYDPQGKSRREQTRRVFNDTLG